MTMFDRTLILLRTALAPLVTTLHWVFQSITDAEHRQTRPKRRRKNALKQERRQRQRPSTHAAEVGGASRHAAVARRRDPADEKPVHTEQKNHLK